MKTVSINTISYSWTDSINACMNESFLVKMPFVKRYKEMDTDLKTLFKSIVKEFQSEKDLELIHEMNGEINHANTSS